MSKFSVTLQKNSLKASTGRLPITLKLHLELIQSSRKEAAVKAGPSLRPQRRRACKPSRITPPFADFPSRRLLTARRGKHMAAVVAGCIRTGISQRSQALLPTKFTIMRLRIKSADIKVRKKTLLKLPPKSQATRRFNMSCQ